MTDKAKPRRLSDTVVPGEDFAAKVKIAEILDREVSILSIEKVEGSAEYALIDTDSGEMIIRDYWNVEVEIDARTYTFSTGAVPISKVLTALQEKLDNEEAFLPLLATFHKEGRTYIVE
jgi:hypothetical protein